MKLTLLPAVLLALTSFSAHALTSDQQAASRAGASISGPILSCDVIKSSASGSSKLLKEIAVNPAFGIIPNTQQIFKSGSLTAMMTIVGDNAEEDVVRLDLYSVKENSGADFANHIFKLKRSEMAFMPTKVADFSLKTNNTSDGSEQVFTMKCSASRPSVNDDGN